MNFSASRSSIGTVVQRYVNIAQSAVPGDVVGLANGDAGICWEVSEGQIAGLGRCAGEIGCGEEGQKRNNISEHFDFLELIRDYL